MAQLPAHLRRLGATTAALSQEMQMVLGEKVLAHADTKANLLLLAARRRFRGALSHI